jgi:hypothetical protein
MSRMEAAWERSSVSPTDPMPAHYALGFFAGCLNSGFCTCPYENNSDARLWWIRGYTSGIVMITRIRKEQRAR